MRGSPQQAIAGRLRIVCGCNGQCAVGSCVGKQLLAECGELQVGVGVGAADACGGNVPLCYLSEGKVGVTIIAVKFIVAYSFVSVSWLVIAHQDIGTVIGCRVSQFPILRVVVFPIFYVESRSQIGIVGQVHTATIFHGSASRVGGAVEQIEAVFILQLDAAYFVFNNFPYVGRIGSSGVGYLQFAIVQTAITNIIAQYSAALRELNRVPMTMQRAVYRPGHGVCEV